MSILHGRNSEQGGAFQLLGVGSPLLDILVQVDDAFLGTIPGEKGGMVMVDAEFQRSVLGRDADRHLPLDDHARCGEDHAHGPRRVAAAADR